MPFDFATKPEVLFIQKMREAFGGGENWCKGHFQFDNMYCLVGQYNAVRGVPSRAARLLDPREPIAAAMLAEAHARHFCDVERFNDHSATRYADIVDFLDAVERRLCG